MSKELQTVIAQATAELRDGLDDMDFDFRSESMFDITTTEKYLVVTNAHFGAAWGDGSLLGGEYLENAYMGGGDMPIWRFRLPADKEAVTLLWWDIVVALDELAAQIASSPRGAYKHKAMIAAENRVFCIAHKRMLTAWEQPEHFARSEKRREEAIARRAASRPIES